MVVRRHRFPRPPGVRAGEAAGVRELQADEQIVGLAETFGVRADKRSRRLASSCSACGPMHSWLGLARPSGCTAAASPPQINFAPLRPKFAQRRSVSRWGGRRGAVPALHGVDAPAVAHGDAIAFEWLGKRRSWTRFDRAIEREGHIQFTEALQERVGSLEGCDARIRHRLSAHASHVLIVRQATVIGQGVTGLRHRPVLRQEFSHELTVDVGEAEVAALEAVGQLRVIEAEEVQHRGVQVVDVDRVLDGVVAEFVGAADA